MIDHGIESAKNHLKKQIQANETDRIQIDGIFTYYWSRKKPTIYVGWLFPSFIHGLSVMGSGQME